MPGIYEMYVKKHFCAAHSLKGYPGDCARMHGHNWMIEVYVRCRELDNIGMGMDFREIKQGVGDVLDDLDHANLDELPAFRDQNPTSENIARLLYVEIGKKTEFGKSKRIQGQGLRNTRCRMLLLGGIGIAQNQ